MKPCLYRTPDKKNLAGRRFEVMDVLPKLLPANQIADGARSHLDPSAKLYGRKILFHMAPHWTYLRRIAYPVKGM